ncbi:MAG TPA: Nif3-like dinuclear metal center hexameric protein [Acidimicrobiia bacterium]|nr:Nif3-like dinuclear metal center hexameric protein [Acidimicrobiia bacterium]
MPTVKDIASAIAARTHPEDTPEWDPVGLQLGDPDEEVDTVAVCHEVTEPVVSRLEESPVDLLVTYHPLLFTPTTRLLAGRSPGARSYRLIRSGVSLLVTHTDFDSCPGGMADSLAALFDLGDVAEFGGDPAAALPAIGRYGTFNGTLATVDAIVVDEFGPGGVRINGDREMIVGSLAVVPGSGSTLIEAAAEVAQGLVTGDVGHHRAVAALDLGLAVVDPGHTATERPGIRALVAMVTEVVGGEVVDLTGIDPRTWD